MLPGNTVLPGNTSLPRTTSGASPAARLLAKIAAAAPQLNPPVRDSQFVYLKKPLLARPGSRG